MAETWFTYRQLAEHWNISAEAARVRARRGGFPRRTNNAGEVEIGVDTSAPVRPARRKAASERSPLSAPSVPPDNECAPRAALEALEGHVATLKDQLAKAEARADTERDKVAELTVELLRLTAELLDAKGARRRSWWQRLSA